VTFVQKSRLRLRRVSVARCHDRRPQALTTKHHRVVEIDERGVIDDFQPGKGERQPAAAQERG
jgi:hypothetical protein